MFNYHIWESGIGTLPGMRPRDVLAANLKALMAASPHLDTLEKITAASGGALSNGKLGRIRSATHATDIDSIGSLAEVFELQIWQLLVPGLNPEVLPQIVGDELIHTIRALLVDQGPKPKVGAQALPSGTKKYPVRLPGEVLRTGRVGGKSGEVNRPGAIPKKRGRGGS